MDTPATRTSVQPYPPRPAKRLAEAMPSQDLPGAVCPAKCELRWVSVAQVACPTKCEEVIRNMHSHQLIRQALDWGGISVDLNTFIWLQIL